MPAEAKAGHFALGLRQQEDIGIPEVKESSGKEEVVFLLLCERQIDYLVVIII